jgi:DNA-binding CsgD family transcriptional regulator
MAYALFRPQKRRGRSGPVEEALEGMTATASRASSLVEIRTSAYFLKPVQRLRNADLEGVVRLVGEVAAIDEAEQLPFPQHLLESLRELVGSDWANYCELDRPGRRMITELGVPNECNDTPDGGVYWRLRHEHPTCSYQDRTGDFSPHKLSDFVTMRQLKRLQIYTDFFQVGGIAHHIDVGLPAPLTHTKMFLFDNSADRGDFGERERTILELVRPHLIRRYEGMRGRRREAAALAALEASDEPLVLLNPTGGAEFATTRARRLLANYGLDVGDIPNIAPLRARSIRPDALFLEERRPLGLTPREREILALVAQGHTNAQVAATLWISPATVGKHLENAYSKLGVGTRTAAVRLIREHDDSGKRRLAAGRSNRPRRPSLCTRSD